MGCQGMHLRCPRELPIVAVFVLLPHENESIKCTRALDCTLLPA
jgi:hypothetical protein